MSPLPAPGAPLPHYVSTAPFDPHRDARRMTSAQSRIHLASQKQLMWWKFKQPQAGACISGIFLARGLSDDPDRRVPGTLRAAYPQRRLSSIRRRSASVFFHEGSFRRPVRLSAAG